MSGDDADLCGIRWCGEVDGHPGPHRQRLYDTFTFDLASGKPTVTQLWLSGESARTFSVAVVVNTCEVGLTHKQVSEMANVLAAAKRRIATS
jgi:hypothetical protein